MDTRNRYATPDCEEGQWHEPPASHLGETYEKRYHGHHLVLIEVSYLGGWIKWLDGRFVGFSHNGLGGVEQELEREACLMDRGAVELGWDGSERRTHQRKDQLR